MTNTTKVFKIVDGFVRARQDAREAFMLTRRRYASAEGSQMFTDKMTEAKERRAKAVSDAQAIARRELAETITTMIENADRIKMQPPTEEQLRILQLLSMKENLTVDELEMAACSMDGNASCLSLLDELARKSGDIHHVPFAARSTVTRYDQETARSAVQRLGDACYRIIDNATGATRAALLAAEYNQMRGVAFDPDELPQEAGFSDELDFYEKLGIPLSSFAAAVD